MCDYCDCRRIPEIADLGAEHERIEARADEVLELARSGSPRLAEAVGHLRDILDPHVAREEGGVFSEARQAGLGAYYVDELEEDHRRFAARLADPHLDVEGLEELFDDLHRHIAIEEYDLFPAVVQMLKDSQWEALAV